MVNNLISAEIDIICTVILLLIFKASHNAGSLRMQAKSFRVMLLSLTFFLLAGVGLHLAWDSIVQKLIFSCIRIFSWMLASFSWLLYIFFTTGHNSYRLRKWLPLFLLPMLVTDIFAGVDFVLSITQGIVKANIPLWITLIISTIFYIVLASAFSISRAKKCRASFLRKDFIYLAYIMTIPLATIILQAKSLDIDILAPVLTLVILHMHLNAVERQITIDPFTGLNNKNKLWNYIEYITLHADSSKRLFALLIEMDNYSIVRKKFGKGNAFLGIDNMARFLRKACAQQNAFLARFENNSFVIVFEKENFTVVENFCSQLAQSSTDADLQKGLRWPLTFSIHWSEYGTENTPNIELFFKDFSRNCYKPASKLEA